MKKILVLALSFIILLSLCACASNEKAPIGDKVSTPYADLIVPESYSGNVESKVLSKEPYVLGFYAKDGTELYKLHFGEEVGDPVGTIKMKDKNVAVYVELAQLDSAADDYQEKAGYQNGLNSIIENLINGGNFDVNEVAEYQDADTFDIKTSVATLKYPAKWKDKVDIDVSDECVKFSNDGTPLFDLYFAETDGFLLGTYDGTPIYVKDYVAETEEQAAMQNDVNVIINNLEQDKKFVVNF